MRLLASVLVNLLTTVLAIAPVILVVYIAYLLIKLLKAAIKKLEEK